MKKSIIIILGVLAFTRCEVLDKEPLSSVSPETFFKNADDAEASLASAYDALQPDSYYGWPMNAIGELPSDNTQTTNGDVLELDNLTWTSASGTGSRLFTQVYTGINRANTVIKYVPTITQMPPERRDEITGEGYFLRALHYFNLVRIFGEVPLRLEPVESGDGTAISIARSTVEEVYNQILEDLEMAETLTSESFGSRELNRARANKITVNALRAKVLLTQGKWGEVLPAATKVLNSPLYTFSANFKDLFPAENQEESILEVQYSGTPDDGGNALPDLNLPSPPATYSFPKFNIPTPELVEDYADNVNDMRWSYVGEVYGGDDHVSYIDKGPGTGNDEGYFTFKHRGEVNAFNSPSNYVIIRLADVMLMYAEASNELNGPNTDALGKLNAIRERAGLSALDLTALPSKQAFRDEVDRQRRLELAFEGERWFDLLRYENYEKANPGANDHQVTALDLIEEKRGSRDENYLVFPIPLNEINNNPLMDQNTGY